MAQNATPPPDESIAQRFMRETAHLTREARQRVLDVLIKAEHVSKARVAAMDAIERAARET